MLRNYLKIAFRIFWKNKGFSLINVAGLTLGISTCLLISLYVLDELSFDSFHIQSDRIYRLTEILHLPKEDRHQALTSPPMAPALTDNFPEVIATTRLDQSRRTLAFEEKKFYDTRIWYADSSFFEIFTFPMLAGDPHTALVQPNSIVLTETAARRFFDDGDGLGKTLIFSDSLPVIVTGIVQDVPGNSHLQFDVILSRTTWTRILGGEKEDNWFDNSYYTYVLLSPGASPRDLEKKFAAYAGGAIAPITKEMGLSYDFELQPLADVHLHSRDILYGNPTDGDIKYIYIFSLVGALVLLVACANYVNLATARSLGRAREIGIRKVIGALRRQLIMQILGESFLLTFLSTFLAIGLIITCLPYLDQLTGKNLSPQHLLDTKVITVFASLFIMIVALAGLYPALLMSSFVPVKSLKGKAATGTGKSLLRESLVVFQFSISIVMIAMTILIYQQMTFLQKRDVGFEKEQIVMLKFRSSVIFEAPIIKREMLQVPGVMSASGTNFSYQEGPGGFAMTPEGSEDGRASSINVISVDEDFLETFGIELLAGNNLYERYKDFGILDSASVIMINESAVKDFGWGTPEEALTRTVQIDDAKIRVVGVVRDFNFQSMHEPIKPLVLFNEFQWRRFIAVRINAVDASATIDALEKKWNSLQLDSPFEYSFMDEDFANLYRQEQRLQAIITFLSSLSVLIATLGLFGLVSFMADQRTKEIGVRKVLGADVANVVMLLSGSFMKLLFVSMVISVPLAWVIMVNWIQGFAFQVELSIWILGGSALLCCAVAVLTVGIQSFRAAIVNPIASLRSE